MVSQNADLKGQNDRSNGKSRILKRRAYDFSIEVIKFLISLQKDRILLIIQDQLIRSATSVCANIIEAQAASSRREFIKYYEISLKSANETAYWLSLLSDTYNNLNGVEDLLDEINEIRRMLGASVLTLKGQKVLSFNI